MSSTMNRGNPTTAADDPRWARVVSRDHSADGQFWYSVATTKVYCRPSCPSRTANPRNVRFHDTLQEAQATGYRACKRCRPQAASPGAQAAALVAGACRLIEQSETPPSLAKLAADSGLSVSRFHRLFKAITGLAPGQYIAARRAARVRSGLAKGRRVTQAMYEAGFNSSGRFYAQARDMLGMTPGRYRAGGLDEELRFAVGQSSLGSVLVASSTKGVVAILIGDDAGQLLRDLQDRFRNARLIGGDKAYEKLVARVVGFVEAPQLGLHLPLDLRGTAFQLRVWRALRAIPAGTTATYAQVARRIGAPTASRAVAGACAANHLAVAIPCHRVVRNDGADSGYAWGIERKRSLIDREAAKARKRPGARTVRE